jgi:DNA binding domain, excisionase family
MTAIYQQAGAEIPAILTKREAANYVRCTPRYIENMIRAGRLKGLKPTGKLVRIRRSDLEKFLESGATIGGDV